MPSTPSGTRLSRLQLLRLLPACLRAAWELALARLRHLSIEPRHILALNAASARPADVPLSTRQEAQAQRAALVIPRVAARLPWRADCLVQALAAQRWLRRHGVAAQIVIGTKRGENGEFLAHAWLKLGDRIITGGDVSTYEILLDPHAHRL